MERGHMGSYRGSIMRRGQRGSYRGRTTGGWRDRTDIAGTPVKENEFLIKPRKSYEEGLPEFKHPRVVGSYSVDTERNMKIDKSQLKYVDRRYLSENVEMKVEFDLKEGLDKDKHYKVTQNDTFGNMLRWIISSGSNLLVEDNDRSSVDFISSRRIITNIAKTPYFPESTWLLRVILYKGKIYFKGGKKYVMVADPSKSQSELELEHLLLSRAGLKLEQFINGEDATGGIDDNSEFRCVLSSHLEDNRLLYSAKLDSADQELYGDDFHDLNSFVTVKCCKELSNDKLKSKFEQFKTCQVWIENHLSGIPRVIFGFRSDDFITKSLKIIKTEDLPKIATKGSWEAWEPNGFMNFLNEFLKYVKQVAFQHPGVVLEFQREKYKNISWEVSDDQNMLPTWYTDNLVDKHKCL